jgi:hypothetical protein
VRFQKKYALYHPLVRFVEKSFFGSELCCKIRIGNAVVYLAHFRLEIGVGSISNDLVELILACLVKIILHRNYIGGNILKEHCG